MKKIITINDIIDQINNFIFGLIIIAVGLVFSVPNAHAATVSTTFGVSATVAATCTVSATNMAFGTYQFTANSDTTSTITVICTPTTQYKVGLSAGLYGTGITNRMMSTSATGTDKLTYFLYRDSSRTQNWGNTPGTDTVDQAGSGVAQNITVYGRINSGAMSVPGNYSDTITVTVTF